MVRIITDSTSDISPEEAEKLGVEVVPMGIVFGEQSYRDGIDISHNEFYQRLTSSKELPTTSQPSPDDFIPLFRDAKAKGDEVVAILLSSKLSGTLQTAVIARDIVGTGGIHIVDSGSVAVGLRLLVDLALKLRELGMSADDMASAISDAARRIRFLALVDTLEYLYRGGRLSRTARIAGGFLGFKPVIALEDGEIKLSGKARGVKRGLAAIMDIVDSLPNPVSDLPVYYGYTGDSEKCDMLREISADRFSAYETRVTSVGCAIGTHAGPGACVLGFISEK